MKSTPSSPARRDRVKVGLLVFVVALAARALALAPLLGTPLLDTIMGDAINYDSWATRIAAGDWIGDGVFYQAPLYPYFLATLYSVFGHDLLAVRAVQIVLGSAACGLLALAGWSYFERRTGIVAGLLLALYAPAIFADLSIQKSVLDVFFVCLALFVLSDMDDRPSAARCLGLGATIGALVLSRENALVFVVVLVGWLFLRTVPPRWNGARAALLFAVGVTVVLLPVALRNWHVSGELHLTTSQFGHNFYIGNNPNADGTYRPLIARRGDPRIERQDAVDLAEQAMGRSLSAAEVSSFYTDRALSYIARQPGDWIALMLRKLALATNAVEIVDTKDQYSHGALSPLLWASDRVFHFGVLAPLAWLGVLITWPKRRRLLPLYLLFVAYTGTLLLFYVFGRYRLPTIPILVLFAAAGVVGLRAALPGLSRRHAIAAGASWVGVVILCNWPLGERSYMRSVTQYNLANELVARGRVDEAIDHYRRAIALHDGNSVAHHNLGSLLASRGELPAALELYDRALEIDDDYAEAWVNRGRVLRELGDLPSALESFEQGLRFEPLRADVHVETAVVCEQLGLGARAHEHFARALAIEPGHAGARAGMLRTGDGPGAPP